MIPSSSNVLLLTRHLIFCKAFAAVYLRSFFAIPALRSIAGVLRNKSLRE